MLLFKVFKDIFLDFQGFQGYIFKVFNFFLLIFMIFRDSLRFSGFILTVFVVNFCTPQVKFFEISGHDLRNPKVARCWRMFWKLKSGKSGKIPFSMFLDKNHIFKVFFKVFKDGGPFSRFSRNTFSPAN